MTDGSSRGLERRGTGRGAGAAVGNDFRRRGRSVGTLTEHPPTTRALQIK